MNSPQNNLNQETAHSQGDAVPDVFDEGGGENPLSAGEVSEASNSAGESPAPNAVLETLRQQLHELRERFDATDAQIANYLREKTGGVSEANGEAMVQVQQRLDRLLSKFEATDVPPSADSEGDTAKPQESVSNQPILDALKKLADYQKDLAQRIVNSVSKRMTEELNLLQFQRVVYETLTTEWDRREAEAEAKARQQAEDKDAAYDDSDDEISLEEAEEEEAPPADAWSRAIWGPDLVEMEGFAAFLDELNRRFLDGDGGVASLAGQLLVFRQAPPEAKPQLLKDVGEAYYRTRLDEDTPDHPFEQALITWLQKDCEKAGLPNTIEVVHPGERFDKSRHSSTKRGGAEVSEVFGWVVLTEGGRVYTRASVAAH